MGNKASGTFPDNLESLCNIENRLEVNIFKEEGSKRPTNLWGPLQFVLKHPNGVVVLFILYLNKIVYFTKEWKTDITVNGAGKVAVFNRNKSHFPSQRVGITAGAGCHGNRAPGSPRQRGGSLLYPRLIHKRASGLGCLSTRIITRKEKI